MMGNKINYETENTLAMKLKDSKTSLFKSRNGFQRSINESKNRQHHFQKLDFAQHSEQSSILT